MSADAYAARVWAEALADPAFVAALEQGKADLAAGRLVPYRPRRPAPLRPHRRANARVSEASR